MDHHIKSLTILLTILVSILILILFLDLKLSLKRKGVFYMMGESFSEDRKIMRVAPFEVKEVHDEIETIPAGVQVVEAPSLWEESNYGEGVVVAVIDTGVDPNHPNLKNNIIDGVNITDEGTKDNYDDGNGHGTHVAGTIASDINDSGVVGVAPKAKILPIKVLTSQGVGAIEWIVEGIRYAVNWRGPNGERVRVINLSLGGPDDDDSLRDAVLEAIVKDISVVVASGNEGDDNESTYEFSYPARYNEVTQISASTLTNELAYYSNNNDEIDCIAPGTDIISTYPNGKFAKLSGTSMATPHVSGAIALLIAYGEKKFKRTLTEAEIYAMLIKRTVSIGYKPTSEGHGLVKLGYMDKVRNLLSYINDNF